jgi:hypothetical protein
LLVLVPHSHKNEGTGSCNSHKNSQTKADVTLAACGGPLNGTLLLL